MTKKPPKRDPLEELRCCTFVDEEFMKIFEGMGYTFVDVEGEVVDDEEDKREQRGRMTEEQYKKMIRKLSDGIEKAQVPCLEWFTLDIERDLLNQYEEIKNLVESSEVELSAEDEMMYYIDLSKLINEYIDTVQINDSENPVREFTRRCLLRYVSEGLKKLLWGGTLGRLANTKGGDA